MGERGQFGERARQRESSLRWVGKVRVEFDPGEVGKP